MRAEEDINRGNFDSGSFEKKSFLDRWNFNQSLMVKSQKFWRKYFQTKNFFFFFSFQKVTESEIYVLLFLISHPFLLEKISGSIKNSNFLPKVRESQWHEKSLSKTFFLKEKFFEFFVRFFLSRIFLERIFFLGKFLTSIFFCLVLKQKKKSMKIKISMLSLRNFFFALKWLRNLA